MAKSIYDQIKKQNGETFAKTLRAYDSGIFDIPNIVPLLKYAGRDAEKIKFFLHSLKETKGEEIQTDFSPFELLEQAGYHSFEADTLEKQNAIQKYFRPDEALCTFKDPKRHQTHYIINAVKKDVDSIKREDFENPYREDKYGTSVISIQISKENPVISIKNRYNHQVDNADNTFNSNPDNIISGLTYAIKKYFNVDFTVVKTPVPNGFVFANFKDENGQKMPRLINYNKEHNGAYICDNIYIKNGVIHPVNKDYQYWADNYLLDVKANKLLYISSGEDAFYSALMNELEGKKIKIRSCGPNEFQLIGDDTLYLKAENKNITYANLPHLKRIDGAFLANNTGLKYLNLPEVEEISSIGFLNKNNSIKHLKLPKLKSCASYFLARNESLETFEAPLLKKIGNSFLEYNNNLKELILPELECLELGALKYNTSLKKLILPNVQWSTRFVLPENKVLEVLYMPKLKYITQFVQSHKNDYDDFLKYHPKRKALLKNMKNGVQISKNDSAFKIFLKKLCLKRENF